MSTRGQPIRHSYHHLRNVLTRACSSPAPAASRTAACAASSAPWPRVNTTVNLGASHSGGGTMNCSCEMTTPFRTTESTRTYCFLWGPKDSAHPQIIQFARPRTLRCAMPCARPRPPSQGALVPAQTTEWPRHPRPARRAGSRTTSSSRSGRCHRKKRRVRKIRGARAAGGGGGRIGAPQRESARMVFTTRRM